MSTEEESVFVNDVNGIMRCIHNSLDLLWRNVFTLLSFGYVSPGSVCSVLETVFQKWYGVVSVHWRVIRMISHMFQSFFVHAILFRHMRWFSLLERKSQGMELNKSLIMQKVAVVWKEKFLFSFLLVFKQKELNLSCSREDSVIQFGRENFLMERKLKMLK